MGTSSPARPFTHLMAPLPASRGNVHSYYDSLPTASWKSNAVNFVTEIERGLTSLTRAAKTASHGSLFHPEPVRCHEKKKPTQIPTDSAQTQRRGFGRGAR